MRNLYVFLLACLLAGAQNFAWAAGPPPPRLQGQWKGALKVPGGALTLFIAITPLADGSYFGTLVAPQQRTRMAMEVTVVGSALTLRIEEAGSSFTGKISGGGTKLTGTWEQPGLTGPLVFQRFKAPARPAVAAAPPPLSRPYRETKVSFANFSGKVVLAGTLTEPAGEGPFPGAVLLSDWGQHTREGGPADYPLLGLLADYLTRRGIAVLRFDDRGVGQSSGPCDTNTTRADYLSDAQGALAFLRRQLRIAPLNVGLIGHGDGANVALLVAARPLAPTFVVTLAASALPGRTWLRDQYAARARQAGATPAQLAAEEKAFDQAVDLILTVPAGPPPLALRTRVAAMFEGLPPAAGRTRAAELTSPWARDTYAFDPLKRLPLVRCPVLLLHGTADTLVLPNSLSALKSGLRKGSGGAVKVQRLAGVNHLMQPAPGEWPLVNGAPKPNLAPIVLETMREWIMRTLPKPSTTVTTPVAAN